MATLLFSSSWFWTLRLAPTRWPSSTSVTADEKSSALLLAKMALPGSNAVERIRPPTCSLDWGSSIEMPTLPPRRVMALDSG